MSNPTTPFGWQMPENTDLVTDLPADFEVFGQAVATSMQDLLGGTTGQVLAKASNTDMDFVWSADAAGMTNPMTTTGDVIYSSPGSTPVRLGIGTANQVLTVNSGATAPQWATPTAGGMTLINAGGTTLTGASITISSIPATYKNLQLVIENYVPITDNAPIHMRFNGDSGTRYASEKYVYNDNVTFNETVIQISQGNDNSVSGGLCITDIFDYAASTRKMVESSAITTNSTTTANFNFAWYYGFFNQTAAITSITLQPTGSGFTSGTVYLYGVK